jgi:hypothetical protein
MERALANTALSYSYGWWRNVLTMIRKFSLPYDEDPDFMRDARSFGVREAHGLINLAIVREKGVKGILRALKYSHWALLERAEVRRVSGNVVRLRVIGCSARRALEKWGLPNYPCRNFTLNALEGFVGAIEPGARVECVFCPPQKQEGNISCEWLIKLSGS